MRRWKNRDRESENSLYSPLGSNLDQNQRDNNGGLNDLDVRQIVGVGALFTTFGAILILASIFFSKDTFDDIKLSGSMIFGLALLVLNITCVIMYFCFLRGKNEGGHHPRPEEFLINYDPLQS